MDDFQTFASGLIGLECWSAIAGEGAGWFVSLDFGAKVKRGRRLTNALLDATSREYEGEWAVFIQNCLWQLDDGVGRTICGCWSDRRIGGEMLTGLRRLKGLRVLGVQWDRKKKELAIAFENSLALQMFEDGEYDGEEDMVSVFDREEVWTLDKDWRIYRERRAG